MRPDEFPKVLGLDSMRRRQDKIIIYDLGVTYGDKGNGLGIVGDEHHTAFTRASDMLIIVGSEELVTTFPRFWDYLNFVRNIRDEPLPYIVEYAGYLHENGLSFRPRTPRRSISEFDVKEEWYKRGESHRRWEFAMHNTASSAQDHSTKSQNRVITASQVAWQLLCEELREKNKSIVRPVASSFRRGSRGVHRGVCHYHLLLLSMN